MTCSVCKSQAVFFIPLQHWWVGKMSMINNSFLHSTEQQSFLPVSSPSSLRKQVLKYKLLYAVQHVEKSHLIASEMLDGKDRFEHFGRTTSSNVSAFAKPALNLSHRKELVVNIIFWFPTLQPSICGWNSPPVKLLQVAALFYRRRCAWSRHSAHLALLLVT